MPCRARSLLVILLLLASPRLSFAQESETPPLKVLLVAGGCCHDYATQTKLLQKGVEERLRAEVTIVFNPSKGTDTKFEIYESAGWADGYDVVIHDECSAAVTDRPYVTRILDAHKAGIPAVNLHCAMHSYRWGDFRQPVEPGADNYDWYEMLGVQSTGHGPQSPVKVTYADSEHPVIAGMENWTTINEELYNNVRVYAGTEVLASGQQFQTPRNRQRRQNADAEPREANAVVVWTNEYGPQKTRIFCTTLGHNNETVADQRYLDLVSRGLLWATGNINSDGSPSAKYAKNR